MDARGDALYFSRAPIPAAGAPGAGPALPPCHAHIGLYAFRRDFLLRFAALPQTPLERIESLEQLRALEHGYRIRTVATQHATDRRGHPGRLGKGSTNICLQAHVRAHESRI